MMSKFYQWVWCLLLVHCALAKFPQYLWLYLDGKRLEKLLHKGATIDNLAKFLTDHPNWYTRYEATRSRQGLEPSTNSQEGVGCF